MIEEISLSLFNSDTLSMIISYLPSVDLLTLALTCKRFGVSNNVGQSLIEESARIAIKDTATEEQLTALPRYNGENSFADYHYLQLMRTPLLFDQLVDAKYVNDDDISCVHGGDGFELATAFSNQVMRTGKHYATFEMDLANRCGYAGVMRPGQANQSASGIPLNKEFFQHFSRRFEEEYNNSNIKSDIQYCSITHTAHYNNSSVQCCFYGTNSGTCYSSSWNQVNHTWNEWEGMENLSSDNELIGMLLDLDEGSLSMYKNGRKLGVMKRGLAGPYCWVVSIPRGVQVTIKRGVILPG